MKTLTKLLAATGLAATALASVPASAQVDGKIATVDTARAIIGTNALRSAYDLVTTTYKAQIDQRTAKQQEVTELLKPFDTDGNARIDDAELPALQQSDSFAQFQRLEAEVQSLGNQVTNARIFAVEQIFAQYAPALEEVANGQQVQIVFPLDAVLFRVADADITTQVTEALNVRVPSVGVVPPQGYRPSQQGAGLFQEIQQRLLTAQLIQQRQQQQEQQGNTEAPAGR
ncbi:MAG: OmpH family outer membrane protein [Erythrobacter sp.]|uniref:OmpH family outer membrane protein n=1 Tax=Erythrobacter sp. TaxID=1042 RepID=UPI00261581DC|nr:OmpH family outer membrane protein [Erythrobacter sp.]MDJ0977206.1 OmpH family outer membrane protein [Erythrobacter sp.]